MQRVTEQLRVVEEFLLLVLDADHGDIRHSFPRPSRAVGFAGAALMDLALEGRVSTDLWRPEFLVVADAAPLGSDLLDPILAEIVEGGEETRETAFWSTNLAKRSDEIREQTLARLTERGILEAENGGEVYLSADVSHARRYHTADDRTIEDVQLRIMRALFSEEIPDPRDIVIVSLASASGVFESILTPNELEQVRERIELISGLDRIGREIAAAIREVKSQPEPEAPSVRPAGEIPEADGLPLLGNVFGMAGDLRGFLLREYERHGPIFRIRALNLRWVALVGPEANVFADQNSAAHFRTWEQYHEFGAALGGHRVLLSMDGPEHIRMRRLLIKGYSPKMLESNLELAHDVTLRAIEGWPEGRPVEIQRAMQQIITEQIGMFCTGMSSEAYFDDLVYFLKMTIQLNITKRLPPVMARLPRYQRAKRRMQTFYDRIMEAHRPGMREGKAPDFVDVLLEANRSDPQLLPETDMIMNVLAPYLVGMDTAASVCAFMLYALLKHPEILARMREEVDEMYETDGGPTPAGMRKLEVTHRVAMETLRMYPVVPALTRTVSNSFEFGGYQVPAGTEVMLGTTVGHHLPDYFPEPDRFDIERYSQGRAEHKQPGAFAPFGVGQHRCIGSGLSELQIALTLAAIVRKADLTLERPEKALKVKLSPAPHPDSSVRMVRLGARG
ncbi:MAG: cytochrome P450 [Caldilineaceae bacterium]|nr:cytochrome P450 [Caldilineaceae bacterium]MDE0338858.1 cytochrome P450 [Caldilineaceae bacterium]